MIQPDIQALPGILKEENDTCTFKFKAAGKRALPISVLLAQLEHSLQKSVSHGADDRYTPGDYLWDE